MRKTKEPRVLKMKEWKSGPDDLVPGCAITLIARVEEAARA